MNFNHAVMWYCLSALKYIENFSDEEIRSIGFEIALKGKEGFDMDNSDKQYYIKSLDKTLSGLEAVSWMYVTWQNIDKSKELGIDFDSEYKTALTLFEKEVNNDETPEDEEQTYLMSFDELGINANMPEEQMLLKAINYLGIKKNSIASIEPKKDEKMAIIQTVELPKSMTKTDKELFDTAVKKAQEGKVAFALEKFNFLDKKYKNNPDILENIARCYLEKEQFGQAISYYKKALEIHESLYGHIGVGNAHSRLGHKRKAIEHYKKAIDIDPAYALCYNNLAAAYSELENFEEAEKNFKKSLDIKPKNPKTLYGLGLLYTRTAEKDKAKKYLQRAKKEVSEGDPLLQHIEETLSEQIKAGAGDKNPVENEDLKKIIELAKEVSGKDFEFIVKNDMTQYAGIKIARKDDTVHQIYYKQEHYELLQHLIAHECGHLIRLYRAAEKDRVVPATHEKTIERAYNEIEGDIQDLSKKLPQDALAKYIKTLYEGIVRQVTNLPVDIMIEKWIYNNYPKLRDNQLKSIEKQAKQSLEVLDRDPRLFPKKFYYCSNVMNYVFLRHVGFTIKKKFIQPYSNTQFLIPGKKLSKITKDEYKNSFSGDVAMINRWAQFLEIKDWFEWRDFEKYKGEL